MNLLHITCTLFALAVTQATSNSITTAPGDSVYAVFVGTTPCGPGIRPLHKVAPKAECAMVEWKLVLYQDPVTHTPTTYKLTSVNRYAVAVTNMYSEPGIKNEIEGKWTKAAYNKKPGSFIYRLDPDKPAQSISFITLGNNLMHVLEDDGSLMVGNPFFNYTLSKVTPAKQ